ncbi:hypothetical protein Tco_0052816 [Tanacetum coccineum]
MEIKSTKLKEKGVVIQELDECTITISPQLSSQQSQDKGKGILIEPVKPKKKKDLIRVDKEATLKLQAEFDEEERLAREKDEKEKEANIALIETWDDIQANINVDHQLAERLQAQEQEELSIEENATLFQQLLEERRKYLAAKRAEEKRNKPPTKAQQKKIMCNYLKNMEGYKLKDLKLKEFDSIQEMFDRAFKRVNTFKDFRTKLVEDKEKRAGTELIQENANKQKVEDDKEIVELKQCLEIIPDEEEVTIDAIQLIQENANKQKVEDDKEIVELKQCLEIIPDEEEVTIDAIHLAIKYPSIVGWKIYKEGRKSYYQIIRADGKSQTHMIFSQMLKSFDKQYLKDLYKLVKAKYESTRPVEDLDLLLCGDLKTVFEPHVEDNIYMLVEKKYPLAPLTLSMMFEKKLIIDYESEMAYQLLKFIIKQLKNYDCSAEVNTASENMFEVTTASEYQVNAAIAKMKLIKRESKVLWLLMINDDLFTCDTPLVITFDEFNRLSRMDDDLSTYEVGILGLSYPLFDEPRCDNLDIYDHEFYERSLCYDEEEKSYAKAVFFINTRLIRLIDVTIEQWLDVKYGNHETMDKNIKDGVISTWLIRSYKQQFNDYVEIKRKNDVFEHNADMECDPSNVEADDEEVLTDKELSNPEELYVDTNLLTHDISGFKTYKENKNAWIHEWNEDVPWVPEESWTMDIVMGETYLELFEIKAWCTFKIMNGIRHLRMEDFEHANHKGADANYNLYLNISRIFNCREEKNKVETIRDEKEPMDDYDTGNLDDHLISNNVPYYEEEEQYKKRGPSEQKDEFCGILIFWNSCVL